MTIAQAINTKLLSISALTALCSTRIYPEVLPDNVVFPAVTYQIITTDRSGTLDGGSSLISALVQIDCRAETYGVADAMAAAVNTALQGFRGTIGTLDVQAIWHMDEQDLHEPDVPVYRRVLEFDVSFTE